MPTTNANGHDFFYADAEANDGAGISVVLLHGFPLDCRIWDNQMPGLSGRFRVITPDLRGFGKSGPPAVFSIESAADDMHALLRQIGALPCILGGLSMGGYVAQALAKKYPTDLIGLMLIDTKAQGDTAQGKESRQKMIELARARGSSAIAEQMLPNMITDRASRPQIASRLMQIMTDCPAETVAHALLALRDREDYTDCLASIPVPTLVLAGQHDAIAPPSVAAAMAAQIPSSTLAIIPDAGHMAPIERPNEVNEVLLKYCNERAACVRR